MDKEGVMKFWARDTPQDFEEWSQYAQHKTLAGAWLAGVDYGRAKGKVAGKEEAIAQVVALIKPCLDRDISLQKLLIAVEDL